ncbi:MAG TPA: prolyl oligopeptidase family serine peptidase [Mycobacteriales bacterium]|nr:prolyl oligopeptidase family serine peptidase [Mycobacteriales bacterium]
MTESFPRQAARTRRFTLGEPRGFTICPAGGRVLFLRSLSGSDPRTGVWSLDLATGQERLVVDPARLGDDADLPPAERARRERVRETASGVVAFTADEAGRTVAFAAGGQLWVADVDTGTARTLPARPGVYDPRVDPTGSRVAYVSGRELRVVTVDGGDDRLLAGEADEAVSWGRAEFVAAEEMDRTRGFWWAPDGSAVLAARVDESPVTQWWIADPAHPAQPPTPVRYPVAGSDNAAVSLHLLRLDGTCVDVVWDREGFPYLARVVWSPEHPPLLQLQSRDQRCTRFCTVDVDTGATAQRHEDSDDVWVELFNGAPTWWGGQIVRVADIGGGRRLVVGDEPVTDPELYVRSVVGASDDGIVFTACRHTPSEVHVTRWTPAGLERLTEGHTVSAAVAAGPVTVISTASLDYDGYRHRVLTADAEHTIASVAEQPSLVPAVRLLRLGPRELSAGLLLPRDHVRGTKLPVLLDPYGGPHAQRVLAARRTWLESQWWADQGFAVLVVDGRGTPGRDPHWEREIHLDVAGPVLDDQVEALHAAADLEPDLDLTRVGIRGWSFGGYLAALAVLRRPDVFHAAVAGAPAVDWAHYDTHYTERYLGRPQDNPKVYEQTSLLTDAAALSRPLLLIHGLADDNVVAAHTLLLSQRLTETGRPHCVLPLTGVTHMTPQEAVAENLLLLQLDFLRRSLPAAHAG